MPHPTPHASLLGMAHNILLNSIVSLAFIALSLLARDVVRNHHRHHYFGQGDSLSTQNIHVGYRACQFLVPSLSQKGRLCVLCPTAELAQRPSHTYSIDSQFSLGQHTHIRTRKMAMHHNVDQIRSRLIRKLGIDPISMEPKYRKPRTPGIPQVNSSGSGEAIAFEQTLTFNCESWPTRSSRRIQFDTIVKVIPIPSHTEYSSRFKKFIWSDNAEIQQNARRNMREFASEGWDWERVVEEDDMFLDKKTKEYIHPVHLGGVI